MVKVYCYSKCTTCNRHLFLRRISVCSGGGCYSAILSYEALGTIFPGTQAEWVMV